MPLGGAVVGSGGSGAVLVLAFPPFDLWWLAPLAVAGLLASLDLGTHRCSTVRGNAFRCALLGATFGLAFFGLPFARIFFGAMSSAGQSVSSSEDPIAAAHRVETAIGFILAGLQALADNGVQVPTGDLDTGIRLR